MIFNGFYSLGVSTHTIFLASFTGIFIFAQTQVLASESAIYKIKLIAVCILNIAALLVSVNLNFLAPIFVLLEFGTVMFLVLLIKSKNLQSFVKQRMSYSAVLVLLPVVIHSLNLNWLAYWSPMYTHFYTTNSVSAEFMPWFIAIMDTSVNITAMALLQILLLTWSIVIIKSFVTVTGVYGKPHKTVLATNRVDEIIFFLRKNMVKVFSSK